MTKPIDTNEIRYELSIGKMLSYETLLALLDEIDRLRGVQQTPPQGKTVQVKVPVWVESNGTAHYYQWNGAGTCYYLTATLPVPAEVWVVARVEVE